MCLGLSLGLLVCLGLSLGLCPCLFGGFGSFHVFFLGGFVLYLGGSWSF